MRRWRSPAWHHAPSSSSVKSVGSARKTSTECAAARTAELEQLARPGQLVRSAPLELYALTAEAHGDGFGLRGPGGQARRGFFHDLGRARDAVHDPLERPDERPVCRDERRGFGDVSRAGDGMERDAAHLLSALS